MGYKAHKNVFKINILSFINESDLVSCFSLFYFVWQVKWFSNSMKESGSGTFCKYYDNKSVAKLLEPYVNIIIIIKF